jgi:hypothetical protein
MLRFNSSFKGQSLSGWAIAAFGGGGRQAMEASGR